MPDVTKWTELIHYPDVWSVDWQGKRWTIPHHMRQPLALWFDERVWTGGGFLTAVLKNDLRGAIRRADAQNLHLLPGYLIWLYNKAPAGSWGGPEVMKIWAESKE